MKMYQPDRVRLTQWMGFAALLCLSTPASSIERTWYHMTTGNGHGFQVFDRNENKITYFLEHPYRYVAPKDAQRKAGIGRRDLAHDIYFGVKVNGSAQWVTGQTNVEYLDQTHIIHGQSSTKNVAVDTYYYGPFGYDGNGMVMLVKLTNNGTDTVDVSMAAKANLKLGVGRVEPNSDNEQITWNGTATTPYGVETGAGGGHAVYIPIGGFDAAACGADSSLYDGFLGGGGIGTKADCSGNDRVLVTQKTGSLAPGESITWGQAVLFVNDNPSDPQAADFKDDRNVNDIVELWTQFIAERDAKTLLSDSLANFEAWRKPTAPDQLTEVERKVWRQSETVLRLGQILEPLQANRNNKGMVLAALPIGEWHTGWVRDAIYGVVALAMAGHTDESQLAMDFFLGAEGGIFDKPSQLGRKYRISACRYFGNGKEEGDWNKDGPNIETDGWGLVLWGARLHLHYSCDLSWLDSKTRQGDTVFEALHQIAEDIEALTNGNLPGPDASIWEVHWNLRQVFTYTAACQVRGLLDFADIADAYGRADLAQKYRKLGNDMLDQSKNALVNKSYNSFASHLGVSGADAFVDGSTVEFFSWFLVPPEDPIYVGTMTQYSRLLTGFGGYRRLEPKLSLDGGGSANEYDLSEWILLDLRIADAWRRMGKDSFADSFLNKVTDAAEKNDFLIPELYDPNNGRYTGVVPMVGYGAGAWMMSQLEKYGFEPPGHSIGFGHCQGASTGTDGGNTASDGNNTGGTSSNDGGAGSSTGTTGATGSGGSSGGSGGSGAASGGSGSSTGATDSEVDWNDGAAGLCAAVWTQNANNTPVTLIVFTVILLAIIRRFGGRHV